MSKKRYKVTLQNRLGQQSYEMFAKNEKEAVELAVRFLEDDKFDLDDVIKEMCENVDLSTIRVKEVTND